MESESERERERERDRATGTTSFGSRVVGDPSSAGDPSDGIQVCYW